MSVLLHLIKWQLGLAPAEIWTTGAERACLSRHAAGRQRLVEIGVWHGGTTRYLRAAMRPDATLYAVDPYPPGRVGVSLPRLVARREVRKETNGTVVWLRMAGAAAARTATIRNLPGLDFVFVDNAQTDEHLRVEWEAWAPLIAPGGVIALHDTRPGPPGMPEQSSEIYAREVVLHDPRFTTVDAVDTLTVLQRLPG